MKNNKLEISNLILFIRRWGIFIIIIGTLIGVSSKFLVKERYRNSIVLNVKSETFNKLSNKENIQNYSLTIDEIELLREVKEFNELIDNKNMQKSLRLVKENIKLVPNIKRQNIEVIYMSTKKENINNVLNIYTDAIIQQMNNFKYSYKITKSNLGEIQPISNNLIIGIFICIGVLSTIIICGFLDIILFRKE